MERDKELAQAYENGENSGYADWMHALDEIDGFDFDADGPGDAAKKVATLLLALREIASMPRTPSDDIYSAANVADAALKRACQMP